MKIYKIIAEKVCQAICHMNYKIVVHQAKMKGENGFTFTIHDGSEVFIDFWNDKYVIYIDGKYSLPEDWNTTMSVKDIADGIIDGLRHRNEKLWLP